MRASPLQQSLFRVLAPLFLILFITGAGGCSLAQTAESYECTDPIGCVLVAPGQPVKLGVMQTLSGGSLPAGLEQERSIRLAVSQRGGQVLGHPIKLIIEDERCSPEGGANGALKIVADPQVVAILGTNCSSAAVTAGKIMSEKGLVMISSANTSPALTSSGGKAGSSWFPGYFRTAWNDAVMGRAAAIFAYQNLGLTRAAVVNAGDTYTKGLTDVFSQVFKDLGGQLVLETTVDEDDTDQRPMLDAVLLSGAQMVFFPLSHPEAGSRIVQQAREIDRLQELVFIGGEGMLSDVFIQQVGPAGQGVYILGPAAPANNANSQLREAYRQVYGEYPPSFYYSFAYDAANLLLTAIETSATRQANGSLSIGRQALRDALYATRSFDGISGQISCDAFGDCGAARLNVVRLENGFSTAEDLRKNVIYTYASPTGQ